MAPKEPEPKNIHGTRKRISFPDLRNASESCVIEFVCMLRMNFSNHPSQKFVKFKKVFSCNEK